MKMVQQCIPLYLPQATIQVTPITVRLTRFYHVFLTDPPHSPIKVRYPQGHLDVQHSTGMITPRYDYGHTLSAQQPPMLGTSLEPPKSSAHIPFSPHYPMQSRNHIDFRTHSPVSSRMTVGVPQMEFRYSPPNERHGPAHDHLCTQLTGRSTADHGQGATSPTETTTGTSSTPSTYSTQVRKEISNLVIACRQW